MNDDRHQTYPLSILNELAADHPMNEPAPSVHRTFTAEDYAVAVHTILTRWRADEDAVVDGWLADRLDSIRGDMAVIAGAQSDLVADARSMLSIAELLVEGADRRLADETGEGGILTSAWAEADFGGKLAAAVGDAE